MASPTELDELAVVLDVRAEGGGPEPHELMRLGAVDHDLHANQRPRR